jgi:hypothetical protein
VVEWRVTPFICRAFLLETYYPFSIAEADYIFFAQKPGDVFLPSGYSLSDHTAHFYSIHILLSEEK